MKGAAVSWQLPTYGKNMGNDGKTQVINFPILLLQGYNLPAENKRTSETRT
jgi:hypothetical protein